MNMLEDRLNKAAEEARRQITGIRNRPATSIQTRRQHRRTLAGALAGAALFIVFGATAFVMSGDTGLDAASVPSTPPTTATPTVITEAEPDDSPDTTTTSIVALTPAPPALTGTPLTIAWRDTVIEAMVKADIVPSGTDIFDMAVFERESDRGLVHATFTTAGGNEWAVAFGPWRDGEYSEDVSELQELFSTDDPGQEGPEGTLFVSGRTDPFYVYLAMDVGKIAVSLQPGPSAPAISNEQLGEIAITSASTVRHLLEADLIEWGT